MSLLSGLAFSIYSSFPLFSTVNRHYSWSLSLPPLFMLRIQVACDSLLIVEVREALGLPLVQKVIVHKLRRDSLKSQTS